MILCDKSIAWWAETYGMISPFVKDMIQDDVISYGVTHAGYDMRLGCAYKVFKNPRGVHVNPKRMKAEPEYAKLFLEDCRVEKAGDIITVPSNSYILGYSIERFKMPPELSGTCVGKSTYARCGIIINTTPLEPGWEGHLTIEIANVSCCPVDLFAEEGIAQVRFEQLDHAPSIDYAGKGGKYQNQEAAPIPARVKSSEWTVDRFPGDYT
jgi:dCTP deaminase